MSASHTFSEHDLAQIAAAVSARVLSQGEERTPQPATAPDAKAETEPEPAQAFEMAAAVLAWFDPVQLQPVGPLTGTRGAAIDALLSRSRVSPRADGSRRWCLLPDTRVRALRTLHQQGLVPQAVRANAPPEGDLVQLALGRGLAGEPLHDADADIAELRACFDVGAWLREAGFDVRPDAEQTLVRIEWHNLLQPFEHLAGSHFRGRADELRRLREFVGVVPPASLKDAALNLADRFVGFAGRFLFRRSPTFAMMVCGPGGVGKSTLVARFMLEHAMAHERDRFPFAYLDFDRPDIAAEEPLTLLAEAVRQLGLQQPELRGHCSSLRSNWLEQLAEVGSGRRRQTLAALREAAVRDAASGLERLGRGERPIVLVLDTFEEVQYLGPAAVDAVWRLLEMLRERIPPLRIVIAGRAEVQAPGVELLRLEVFDEAAAVAYLRTRGVARDELALRVFKQYGGSPLTLKLAAELLTHDASGLAGLPATDAPLDAVGQQNIQRQLYRRVLGHIHDPDIRRLAHPGLVLRRITPEIIREVLATPCQVPVPSVERADELFDKLAREVSLVSLDSPGALRHRADLRALMIKPLRDDQPAQARAIDEAAVAYYGSRKLDVERAEELYHRLWLDHPDSVLDKRWRQRTRRWLVGAVGEFEPRRRAALAGRLGVPVDDEARRAARLPDWERIVANEVRGLLPRRRPGASLSDTTPEALGTAVQALSERHERSAGSPLPALHARVLVAKGEVGPALQVLREAARCAQAAGLTAAAVSAELEAAELVLRHGRDADRPAAARALAALEAGALGGARRLRCLALRAFLEPWPSADDSRAPHRRVASLLERTAPGLLRADTGLAWWAGAAPGPHAWQRAAAALRLGGLPPAGPPVLRELALALARFDAAWSAARQDEPGAWSRPFDIPPQPSLTEAWSSFVLNASAKRLHAVVLSTLHAADEAHREVLLPALRLLMLDALGLYPGVAPPALPPPGPGRAKAAAPVSVSGRQRDALLAAIEAVFTPEELRTTLLLRLNRSLEAYAAPGPWQQQLGQLLVAAEREGWLPELVAALLDARPTDWELTQVAARLGFVTLAASPAVEHAWQRRLAQGGGQLDLHAWRQRLQQIEQQVCRVEVDGDGRGTGFLVGPDVLLTAYDVVEGVLRNQQPANALAARFDFKGLVSGQVVSAGAVFSAAHAGVLVSDAALGYALVRLLGAPGAQPVGDAASSEAAAPLRRWIEIDAARPAPVSDNGLLVVHHPMAGPLKAAFGTLSGLAPIRYDLPTEPGSAGAPVFDAGNLQPLAIHLGRSSPGGGVSFGIELREVLASLADRGQLGLLSQRFA